jgi:4-hydroxy-tetrahydrodipicolinate reductase
MPIHLAIAGAAGRMGKRLIVLSSEQKDTFQLVAAIDAPHCIVLGQDAGAFAGSGNLNVPIATSLDSATTNPDVIIDFTTPAATRALIPQCVSRKVAMVIGTTGLAPADHALIDEAAKTIPILQAYNTSLGVNVLLAVAAQIARQLGPDYDIEITEAHHNQKKDAPSGTAMALVDSICRATGRDSHTDLVYGREGLDAQRKKGTIGMHAIRMGDVVGEHTIYYATPGERIELKHIATTRDTFVKGALRAATFVAKAKPGRYAMKDVLGLA